MQLLLGFLELDALALDVVLFVVEAFEHLVVLLGGLPFDAADLALVEFAVVFVQSLSLLELVLEEKLLLLQVRL